MNSLLFAGQENVGLRAPPGKDRLRLKSVPEFHTEKGFKTPRTPLHAPSTPLLQRPVLGSLKKATRTPNVRPQPANLGCLEKNTPLHEDEEPDIELMFPYRPDEFEQYGLADGVVYISCLPLAGAPRLPRQPVIPETDDITLDPCDPLPLLPPEEHGTELDDFLMTLHELTVDLPPPPEDLPEF